MSHHFGSDEAPPDLSTWDLVFDLDGTIVDSLTTCTEIMREMVADRGLEWPVTRELVRPHVTLGGAGMMQAVLGEVCRDATAEIAEFRRRYGERITPHSELFAGVREGLILLTTWGARLSICSNKPQDLCDKVLADLGLTDIFTAVVGTSPGIPKKPAPDLFNLVIDRLGAPRARVCYVGDAEIDREMAENLEIDFVAVAYGYVQDPSAFDGAALAQTFSAVPQLVLDLHLRSMPLAQVARAS